MEAWLERFSVDPIPALIASNNDAVRYFTVRDLCDEEAGPVERLWSLREPCYILKKQLPDGSWKYPGSITHHKHDEDFFQLETFRQLGILIEKYGLNNGQLAIGNAAEFLFSRQSEEGDFRGITGNQYAPHYTGGIMELLIKAGYANDTRIEKGFRWLLKTRQDDGGWAWPIRTRNIDYHKACESGYPVQADRSKPFSHTLTGVVLRAFAAHPAYRMSPEARHAGMLLESRLFMPDKYVDRKDKKYWEAVSFPFWFTDIVSALDSLGRLGFTKDDLRMGAAVKWLTERQGVDGLFRLRTLRDKDPYSKHWVSLAVCRAIKRLY